MILKSTLEKVLILQLDNINRKKNTITRENLPALIADTPFIKIIKGIRRCGKSTLMHQIILNKETNPVYLNFEDPKLSGFELNDFNKLDEIVKNKNSTLYFDEIQNIAGWEKYVRTKHDEGQNIYITGSNASILSMELGTKLTGRHISTELFPFSYSEYLILKNKKPNKESLQNYLNKGGFPEFLKSGNEEILYQMLDDIIYRDIAVKYSIRHYRTLKMMAVYLISNTGKLFSYNGLKKIFELGAANTASDYVSFFEDSYLLFTVPKFSYSLKKQLINPRKIYAIDSGFASVNSLSYSKDLGRKLENIIFLHLKRKYKTIHYYSEKKECDFIVSKKGEAVMAIQSCYELNSDNLNREINGLLEAMQNLNIKNGLVITLNQDDLFEKDGKKIKVIAAHKWLLN